MSNHAWDLIVIGGGAAGLWCAGTAALRGRRVLILEKNRKAGPKILMSGGTRCNITHHCDWRGIVEAFGKEGKFLSTALNKLTPSDVVRTIEAEGVATKIESTGKVFPVSDRAIDVRDALVRRFEQAGGKLETGIAIENVQRSPDGVGLEVTGPGLQLSCERLMIATGGLSYPGCGTTGDGYPWLSKLGHTITPLRPALTPLVSSSNWVHELQGITLNDARVTVQLPDSDSKKKDIRLVSRGGLLWTHFGLSGPAPMNVSRSYSDSPLPSSATLLVDLFPDESADEIERWLTPGSGEGRKSIQSRLTDRLPKRLAQELLTQSDTLAERPLAELAKKQKLDLVRRIKGWPVPIHGTRGYAKAEVTAGGVDLSEVDPRTMESKIVPGLFLAGEILNLDGPIGGYNFQAAFSTGHLAGLNA